LARSSVVNKPRWRISSGVVLELFMIVPLSIKETTRLAKQRRAE
jgi:hypothetical protein